VRTLVVSDFHLGGRLGHDVLRRPGPLAQLLEALDHVDRLVLLGDIVELMEGRAQRALEISEPVMRAIGARLGPEREVIIVPGNHDAPLIRGWLRSLSGALDVATPVPLDATPTLARFASTLAPARVRASYPGVWLGDRVWATHGHYLDRHLLPVSAYGVTRGLIGRLPNDQVSPLDYERARRPSLTRATRVLPRPLAALVDDVAEIIRAATMPRRELLHRRFAPLISRLLSAQMRRASMPALARVVHRLGIEADWVVFGHVHRLGPLAGDAPAFWAGPGGSPRLVNTGSWMYEPLLLHRAAPPHPYWPGGAVLLDGEREPQAVGLLDGLPAAALH
jgi:UDP-2,3-diacylglucosamine pyrophosphatase LpxH